MATAVEIFLGFAVALRGAGVMITPDRERGYLDAVAAVGADHQAGVYWAGRATLCGCPADLERYDLVYAAWFGGQQASLQPAPGPGPPGARRDLAAQEQIASLTDEEGGALARASRIEVLRRRDIAGLSGSERASLAAAFAQIRLRAPLRSSARLRPDRRGRIDARATLRDMRARLGEPGPLRHRHRLRRPRTVVLLVDISGSMSGYADSLLRLGHTWVAAGGRVEVFTVGTRVTRITPALRLADPDRALVACAAAIPDWSGGTRLADGLAFFLNHWGRRGLARGAVVVIVSDGWERGDPSALGEQTRRLRAVAHAVIWANPHLGTPGYAPIQGGIMAAMPHLDGFVAGHSLAAFGELTSVVSHA